MYYGFHGSLEVDESGGISSILESINKFWFFWFKTMSGLDIAGWKHTFIGLDDILCHVEGVLHIDMIV